MVSQLGLAHVPSDQRPADLALLAGSQELRDEFEVELLTDDSTPANLEEFSGPDPEDDDHLANFNRLKDLLRHCTFVFEAYEDNGLLYGYWRGYDDSISARDAAVVTYDDEGQIEFDTDSSILEALCQRRAFFAAEDDDGDEEALLAAYRERFAAAGVELSSPGSSARESSLELAAWIDLVGRGEDHPSVRSALADVGMGKIPMIEGSSFDLALGATVSFEDPTSLEFFDPDLGGQAGDRSVMQVLAVHVDKYSGPLPFDIPEGATRSAVHNVLGEPRSSDEDDFLEEWIIGGRLVSVFYTDDFEAMETIVVSCGE